MASKPKHPDPIAARMATRTKYAGDVEAMRALVWKVLKKLEAHIKQADMSDPTTLRYVNSVAQVGPLFIRCVECGELENHLALLESERGDS